MNSRYLFKAKKEELARITRRRTMGYWYDNVYRE